uniref:GTPase Der n=1 Tax=Eucampia antarctica TaxID=49252 RepID=A0A7S2WMX9_9STRA|mmetsp:Transcript_6270/g.5879  ORF Transcript_6270/g.5879 Transcript_6270/m.5879 type:complete len:640 (+) Transcript_6270:107-2026(+)|eukprot:CAMPEP_0197824172 /NCGR_PEP_ID=MMETSP1437-20131217/1477_1 /TAXON_ID=49252 ORGANISM="Eucampia antarctica, Strain CCMP1452" /NCGR_SAMPLE_ID=MMETSP1437 /ASSEMBLY_ACC=CAM_ASM_001096 /LENGTH=639 /DNA_ID=CAMNT_0043423713 /DNA_START=86 /DNA_END=2005 /DNA_ORIENTATION=-
MVRFVSHVVSLICISSSFALVARPSSSCANNKYLEGRSFLFGSNSNSNIRHLTKVGVAVDRNFEAESFADNLDGDDFQEIVKEAIQKPIRRARRNKKVPLIAIVGRPNVGKSAFVNRIAGTQSGGAIVADEAGITRDRTYRNAEFLGEQFQLVDTGGLVFDDRDGMFAKEIREQAMIAIEESVAVILVVDGQVGMTTMDDELGTFLRKEITRDLPVHVAVNKCESEKTGGVAAAEFWNLGLGEPFAVSALHGVGTAELMETVFASIVRKKSAIQGFGTKAINLKEAKRALKDIKLDIDGEDDTDKFLRKYNLGRDEEAVIERYEEALASLDYDDEPEEINVAIVGRPNVGKSSLLNAIFGTNRAIVSDVAGTTRDSIDAVMERPAPENSDENPTLYRFVDTAGIRRKGKIEFGPEFFMVNRALRAIRRADVVLLILDVLAGVTEQDRILAQKVADDGRACVIVCNKWDAVVDKDSDSYVKSVKYIREELPQVRWAPILFTSAATGQRVNKIYGAVDEAVKAHRKRISTAILNEVLRDAILWQRPPAKRNGAQAKIYYCNQVSTRPPTIVVFCNEPSLINDNYKRYLDRKMRESLSGFEATPVRWIFRGRRVRDVMRARKMNGNPGDGGTGTSFPFPHAD